MLRRGGIGGSVGVWRGSRCPYRPSTASSPDPCPRATSHTVMDYARVDAHPRSMLHWAAKTNHQPLKGRSSHRRYHFNPILIPHRIVVTHTHRPRVRGQREISVQKRADSRLALASFFFFPSSCFLAIYTLFRFFVNCCSNRDLRFTIDDRSVRGTFLFFYRFNFFFFYFYFRQFRSFRKRKIEALDFFREATSMTNELDLLTEVERGDPTERFVSDLSLCLIRKYVSQVGSMFTELPPCVATVSRMIRGSHWRKIFKKTVVERRTTILWLLEL